MSSWIEAARFRGAKAWAAVFDRRRFDELSGRRVVFECLKRQGRLDGLRGKRILEIGPKHGQDSILLAALEPAELVLLDLPEKTSRVREWIPTLRGAGHVRFIEGNVLYLTAEQQSDLGAFDLVWCCGVLYHNVEQLRLVRRLFQVCRADGVVVIETATTRTPALADLNVVELHWPIMYRGTPTITHLPSRSAVRSWMEMVGFAEVKVEDVYSSATAWQRAVLTGVRRLEAQPYINYRSEHAGYLPGEAT